MLETSKEIYLNRETSFRYWPIPKIGGAANSNDNAHKNVTCFEDQNDSFVFACQSRCTRTTDKYLTTAIAVIVKSELKPV